ncbi:hypothetical protein J0A71_03g06800 [Encephalitozoon cuniculi]|nr:hypothetical protein J0A71_03g06800 [Encephalitozoon cuniculi]
MDWRFMACSISSASTYLNVSSTLYSSVRVGCYNEVENSFSMKTSPGIHLSWGVCVGCSNPLIPSVIPLLFTGIAVQYALITESLVHSKSLWHDSYFAISCAW